MTRDEGKVLLEHEVQGMIDEGGVGKVAEGIIRVYEGAYAKGLKDAYIVVGYVGCIVAGYLVIKHYKKKKSIREEEVRNIEEV